MKHFEKIVLLIILCYLYSFNATSQDLRDTLISRFKEYRENVFTEKIFLHTDQSTYLAGESIWFKIYCLDGSFHKPLTASKVAYLELIDNEKKVVLQRKIGLHASTGSGAIFLPSSLISGNYSLRVYTQWMRNFDDGYFFQQPVTVINAFTQLEPNTVAGETKYDVQFFPEGGNLVEGLTSTVGVRAVNKEGKGIQFRADVLNEHNDTIAHFEPRQFGLGRFTMKPLPGHCYKVVLRDQADVRFEYTLPAILTEGFVLHLKDTVGDKIKIHVTSNFRIPPDKITCFVHTRMVIKMAQTHRLSQGETTFILDKKLLGPGISHFTLFDQKTRPVCERLYFSPATPGLNIDLKDLHARYGTRQKIHVLASSTNASGDSLEAGMSIAVYKVDSLEHSGPRITTSVLLTSDLKGAVESPDYYTQGPFSAVKIEATDNLMLTHGWSRFRFDEIIQHRTLPFLPETDGHRITGKVSDHSSHQGAPGIVTYLAFPSSPVQLYVSRSNEQGNVLFEVKDFYSKDVLVAQTNLQKDSVYDIEIGNPFSEKLSSINGSELYFPEKLRSDVEQRSIHLQVARAFQQQPLYTNRTRADVPSFYGRPDISFTLDDYTRFPSMEEVMREYIKKVVMRRQKGQLHFFTWNNNTDDFFATEPLILLDGVPVFSDRKLLAFDPLKIKSLDVVTQIFDKGPLSTDGILSYKTYKNDLGGFQLDPKVLTMNYEGIQREKEFFMPLYNGKEATDNPTADARHLLFWSPDVNTPQSGKRAIEFYSSDLTGKYRIVVQAISKNGQPGYFSTTFEVAGD